MAKKIPLKKQVRDKAERKQVVPETPIGFTRKNYMLFGIGLGLVIIGFIALTSPVLGGGFPFIHLFKAGNGGWLTLTLAPLLLVLGYCVIIPWSIIAK